MDREKLIEALDKCYGQPETCGVSSCPYWDLKHPYCECEDRMRKDAIALLKEQEAVVRCISCTFYRSDGECALHNSRWKPEGFCSWAIRKEGR